ncbi:hypothetical protein ACN38_g2232 [Penicillium nordicum]|uniref:Uncharacterized protein n=1 Tax=Penicillium nordicum TaxID=229535 RepID=A0A0N0RZP9_9EURO|nr:hypothetical protein ACN38_g2232 [Penicillium nordicum]
MSGAFKKIRLRHPVTLYPVTWFLLRMILAHGCALCYCGQTQIQRQWARYMLSGVMREWSSGFALNDSNCW